MDATFANDVLVREGNRLWYLSREELSDLNIYDFAVNLIKNLLAIGFRLRHY